ncbi:MAG: 4-vinyl reductase [Candidatus Woesearchaeota archaeon]
MLSSFVKKLLFASEFMLQDGRNEMLGERQALIPSKLLTQLQDISPKKAYEISKRIMKEETDVVTQKIGESKAEMITAMKDFFETLGLGNLEIVDLDLIKKRAIFRIHDSPIAVAHIYYKKKENCSITAGVIAGMMSSIFDTDADAIEKECMVNGSAYCEFVIKTEE